MSRLVFVEETIAAIATASGPAGIGIVRVSGPQALAVADRLTRTKPEHSPSQQTSHTLHRYAIRDPQTQEILDDALIAVFRAPRSFTGEDVIEIQGHGGAVTLSRVLAACLAAGARMARPGEFSERAFVQGKLDLAQAEAIAALISAQTVAAQRAARRQLSGDLSRTVTACADAIKEALARIEASIDFPEEVGEIDADTVDAALAGAETILTRLLATADYGRRLTEGVTLVLAGRPNVGKSSLLNALAGRERSIVTPIAGTTRDVVEEALNVGGIPVRALDTAGIRITDDPVERIGVERARHAVAEADLVIAVLDATTGLTSEDTDLLTSLSDRPAVIAVNKADLADPQPLLAALPAVFPAVSLAAATGAGLPDLTETIVQALSGNAIDTSAPLVTSARHRTALEQAQAALARARYTLSLGLPAELIAVDAHAAIAALGEITGETTREEIIVGIFTRFCIGK